MALLFVLSDIVCNVNTFVTLFNYAEEQNSSIIFLSKTIMKIGR